MGNGCARDATDASAGAPGRIKTTAAGRAAMRVLGVLGALPADVDVSVGSVLPEARALKGR